jgi:hypothetical protein
VFRVMLDAGAESRGRTETSAWSRRGAMVAVYHAKSEHTWMAVVVEAVEVTLERRL